MSQCSAPSVDPYFYLAVCTLPKGHGTTYSPGGSPYDHSNSEEGMWWNETRAEDHPPKDRWTKPWLRFLDRR